jgi:hypothetical protein
LSLVARRFRARVQLWITVLYSERPFSLGAQWAADLADSAFRICRWERLPKITTVNWNELRARHFDPRMANRPEDQPWYPKWREALERVIAAQMKRDSSRVGTPEREEADREYDAAMALFRAIASEIR